MKSILFDLTSSQPLTSKYHGVGLYTDTVFLELAKHNDSVNILALYDSNKFLNPSILETCNDFKIKLINLDNFTFDEIVKKYSPDLFFTSHPTKDRIVNKLNTKFFTVIHDIRTIDCYYDSFYWSFIQSWVDLVFFIDSILLSGLVARFNTKKNLKNIIFNSNFVVVSNHTKFHLLTYFPQLIDVNIPVFYSPMIKSKLGIEINDNDLATILNKKYFFMDSGWRWMKNNLRAAIALDEILDSDKFKFHVVIVGVKNPKSYLRKIKNVEHFIFLDYVENEELEMLHSNAYCFVYPSLAEGFGYSPLKSMKYNVPVVASCFSSIPEICGDAALYFNPKSIVEIKNRCMQILDSTIYNEYKNKLSKNYKRITKKQEDDLRLFVEYLLKITNS